MQLGIGECIALRVIETVSRIFCHCEGRVQVASCAKDHYIGYGGPTHGHFLVAVRRVCPIRVQATTRFSWRLTTQTTLTLFHPNKSKQWKPAATLNGRPYVPGAVPHSPSYREVEFEGLLRSNGSSTKVISLNRSPERERPPVPVTSPSVLATPGHEPAGTPKIKVTSPVPKPTFLTPLRTDSPSPHANGQATPREDSGSPLP